MRPVGPSSAVVKIGAGGNSPALNPSLWKKNPSTVSPANCSASTVSPSSTGTKASSCDNNWPLSATASAVESDEINAEECICCNTAVASLCTTSENTISEPISAYPCSPRALIRAAILLQSHGQLPYRS